MKLIKSVGSSTRMTPFDTRNDRSIDILRKFKRISYYSSGENGKKGRTRGKRVCDKCAYVKEEGKNTGIVPPRYCGGEPGDISLAYVPTGSPGK